MCHHTYGVNSDEDGLGLRVLTCWSRFLRLGLFRVVRGVGGRGIGRWDGLLSRRAGGGRKLFWGR